MTDNDIQFIFLLSSCRLHFQRKHELDELDCACRWLAEILCNRRKRSRRSQPSRPSNATGSHSASGPYRFSPQTLTLPPSFLIMKKTRRNLAGARTALATLRTNLCLLHWQFHWGWLNQHSTHRQRLRFMGLASTLHQRKTQRRRWLRICCRG